MKMVVGLGNPGRKYKNTRHNIGFDVLEELAERNTILKEESRFDAIVGHIKLNQEKVLLVKPLTYMNLSGKAVQPLAAYYRVSLTDLLVVYDDMDLEPGVIRLRASGGAGGHRGMVSIIDRLGSKDFPRLRIGIGRPPNQAINWVLGHFAGEDRTIANNAIKQAADAIEIWLIHGIQKAMNEYN
ncbi:aminoacyl-tRNA hydrolase [Syntrophomonas erecta]